jgi:hypothetical protein
MTETAELSNDEYSALLDDAFDVPVVGYWTVEAEASN